MPTRTRTVSAVFAKDCKRIGFHLIAIGAIIGTASAAVMGGIEIGPFTMIGLLIGAAMILLVSLDVVVVLVEEDRPAEALALWNYLPITAVELAAAKSLAVVLTLVLIPVLAGMAGCLADGQIKFSERIPVICSSAIVVSLGSLAWGAAWSRMRSIHVVVGCFNVAVFALARLMSTSDLFRSFRQYFGGISLLGEGHGGFFLLAVICIAVAYLTVAWSYAAASRSRLPLLSGVVVLLLTAVALARASNLMLSHG